MKFIDDKGKIFGKINLIDFLVVLFLLCLTPMIYFGNKILLANRNTEEFSKVLVQVKFCNIIPELADVICEGDILKDSAGRDAGVLEKIISNKPSEALGMNLVNLKDNNYVLIQNPLQRDIVALFEVKCAKQNGVLYFDNSYMLKIGSNVVFASDLYNIQGVVTSIKK